MATAVNHSTEKSLQNAVLVMVLLNAFATPLMLSSVNVALPALAQQLQVSAVALSWVPMAYLMAGAMFILVFGRLADMYGRKRLFLIGTAAVIVTSILAALSVNIYMLLSARFLQGVSAAMLYATQIAIVSSVFPARHRGRAIGLVVSAIYVGLACGPVLGGLVIEALGWRYSFVLQVPLALAVLLFGLWKVDREWFGTGAAAFDFKGAVTYAGAILLFCLGVSRLPALDACLLLVLSVITVIYFLRHARRIESPLWDVELFFSNRLFTFSSLVALIMYSATYANVVLISLFLQYLKALPPGTAGLIMMVQPLCMAVLSPLMGQLSDRVEPRLQASLGMALTALGLGMLAFLNGSSSLALIVLALVLTGTGFSVFSSPNVNAIMGAVAPSQYGSAAAAVGTTRVIGQLTSMVLVTLAMTLVMGDTVISPENYPQLESAITLSFSIAALICLPGIVLSILRGRTHGAA